jgi:hypothetical protein
VQIEEKRLPMQICLSCNKEKEDKDFYLSDLCYRCQYRLKTKSIAEEKKIAKCKICSKVIPEGNKVYCSTKCLYIGKLNTDKTYWFRKCTAPPVSWKK